MPRPRYIPPSLSAAAAVFDVVPAWNSVAVYTNILSYAITPDLPCIKAPHLDLMSISIVYGLEFSQVGRPYYRTQ